jgi:NAD(P)-dependent dehydrogenase (short-subunit alcohol dehydrogenase family)
MKDNRNSLRDKTFLVTGASSGIGREISIHIASNEGSLYITGRNPENLHDTSSYFNSAHIKSFVGDLTRSEFIKDIVKDVLPLDGLVLCAGMIDYKPMKFLKEEQFSKIFMTNYFAPNMLLQELIKNKKIKNGASIVFISSISAIDGGSPGLGAYSGSKAALIATSKVWALELASNKIRVNVIAPGMVQTPMTDKSIKTLTKEALEIDQKKYPLGYGMPQDVAGSTIFLLSDSSKWMTGSTLVLDGGFLRK